VRELAQYGPRPAALWQSIPYCVRVMLRKKELSDELADRSAQRKRAEDDAKEALSYMGHALYAMRHDPRMGPLLPLVKAIVQSANKMGDVEARGEQRQKAMQKELGVLARKLAKQEELARPLREKEAGLAGQLAGFKARQQQAMAQLKKLDTELEQVRAGKLQVDAERFGVMQAERNARHGELQTLGVQMHPIEESLSGVRGQLEKHLRAIAGLQAEHAQTVNVMQRAEQQQRVSAGSAESNYKDALISLGKAALEQNLAGLAPDQAGEAADGVIKADKKRKEEELYRAAVMSYDEPMYKKGFAILLGGSAALFFGFALMVIF
jgi:hypothetical protein